MTTSAAGRFFSLLVFLLLAPLATDEQPRAAVIFVAPAAEEPGESLAIYDYGTPDYYVTAAAGGSGDGSVGDPWTFAQMKASAVAGDVIQVGPGLYTATNTGEKEIPAHRMANSGTAENPIIVVAQYPAAITANTANWSELSNGYPTEDNGGSPSYGCATGDDYIYWDGFYVNEEDSASTTDTGPVLMWGTEGCEIRRAVVEGDEGLLPPDNHNSVRIELANNVAVRDSKLFGNRVDLVESNRYNGSTIETYDSYDLLIENNELYDSAGGIFIKGTQRDQVGHTIVIRNNYIHDVSMGIAIAAAGDDGGVGTTGSFGAHVYGNIVENTDDAIVTRSYETYAPHATVIANNTVIGVANASDLDRALYIKAGNYDAITWQNNIVVNTEYFVGAGEETSAVGIDMDYQLYHEFSADFGNFNGSGQSTFALWKANTPWDDNSIESDPLFEDEEGGDYRLATGSPGLDAGIDVLDLLGEGTSGSINIGAYYLPDQTNSIGVRLPE